MRKRKHHHNYMKMLLQIDTRKAPQPQGAYRFKLEVFFELNEESIISRTYCWNRKTLDILEVREDLHLELSLSDKTIEVD